MPRCAQGRSTHGAGGLRRRTRLPLEATAVPAGQASLFARPERQETPRRQTEGCPRAMTSRPVVVRGAGQQLISGPVGHATEHRERLRIARAGERASSSPCCPARYSYGTLGRGWQGMCRQVPTALQQRLLERRRYMHGACGGCGSLARDGLVFYKRPHRGVRGCLLRCTKPRRRGSLTPAAFCYLHLSRTACTSAAAA